MSDAGASPPPAPVPPKRGVLFNLGAFFGHIAQAVKADVHADRAVLKHETTQEQRATPVGQVTIRRTVIEELRVDGQGPPGV